MRLNACFLIFFATLFFIVTSGILLEKRTHKQIQTRIFRKQYTLDLIDRKVIGKF